MTTLTKPGLRPANPNFSSGPCAKRPGWSVEALRNAALGRSHRAKIGKTKLEQAIELTREILQVPVSFLFEGGPGGGIAKLDGMSEAPSPSYVSDFLATSEGLALTRAFTRITDAKLRRSIVDMVDQIAAREPPISGCPVVTTTLPSSVTLTCALDSPPALNQKPEATPLPCSFPCSFPSGAV